MRELLHFAFALRLTYLLIPLLMDVRITMCKIQVAILRRRRERIARKR